MNNIDIKRAAEVVAAGGVIAYATESVFGLGCDPSIFSAVERILELKQRSISKGLIVIAADFSQIESYLAFPDDEVKERVLAAWPGPTTWIVPARKEVPHWLTGGHSGLAVRVTDHPQAKALCNMAGPLVSTSANPGSQAPARNVTEVSQYFYDALDYVLPGEVGSLPQPTAIKDALTGVSLR